MKTILGYNEFNPTPLQEKLAGRIYPHWIYCNANRRKPIDCDMCMCLHVLQTPYKRLSDAKWL